jgi:hypothetical protein
MVTITLGERTNMKRILLHCILASTLASVSGCRTPPPKNALTAHEEMGLSALTRAADDKREKVVAAEKHLATLQDGGAEQKAIQKATSELEHHRRILKALEDRWNHERDELIKRR